MSHAVNSNAPKPEPEQEPTGPIAADSLAAESIQNDGGFSENKDAVPMGVKGAQSTLNTTDTSGADVLPAATDSASREKQEALGQGEDVKGVTGLKYPDGAGHAEFDGHHSAAGEYTGGPSSGRNQTSNTTGDAAGASDFGASTISSSSGGPDPSQIRSGTAATEGASSSSGSGSNTGTGANTGAGANTGSGANTGASASSDSSSSGPSAGTGVRPQVDAAPNYTTSVTGAAVPEGTFKPKGANLDDADQTDSIPQTKTFVGAVGTINDPGRLAERDFEGQNNDPVGKMGEAGQKSDDTQDQSGSTGQFDVLSSERA